MKKNELTFRSTFRSRMPAVPKALWLLAMLICLNGCISTRGVPGSLNFRRDPSSDSLAPATTMPPLDPAQQHRLVETERYCAWCHSQTGARPISPAPKLAGQQAEYLVDQINDFRSHKRDNPLAKEIMWNAVRAIQSDLIPYLAQFYSSQKVWSSSDAEGSLVAAGKQIYSNGVPSHNVLACIYCHGPEAKGNAVVPRLASQDRYYIKRQLLDWRQGYRAYAEPMPEEAKGLNEDEIDAVAAYVSSLQ